MKQANKASAKFALIIGDSELESGAGVLRDMCKRDAEQQEVKLNVEAIAGSIS